MHLAAESHVDRSIDGPIEFIQTNIISTFVLLEESRDYWSSQTTPLQFTGYRKNQATISYYSSLMEGFITKLSKIAKFVTTNN